MQTIVTYAGKTYGVMNSTDVQLAYYNVKLFKRAGLPVPWQPHSFADIVAASKALKLGAIHHPDVSLTREHPAARHRHSEALRSSSTARMTACTTVRREMEIGGPGFTATWKFLAAMRPYEENGATWSNPNASSIVNLTTMPAGKVGIVFDGSWVSSAYIPKSYKPWPGFATTFK